MNSHLHAPPLIRAKQVAPWIVLRDLVLTAIAWIVIVQSMRYGLYLLYDYFSPPAFEFTRTKLPQFLEIWNPLKGFVLDAVLLVIWLSFWAFYGTRRFRTKPPTPQPSALPVSEHARYLGVNETDVAIWKTYRIAVVHFNADTKIVSVSPQELASAVRTATA